jgi:hypothetical protein
MLISWTIRVALLLLWIAWFHQIVNIKRRAQWFHFAGLLAFVTHVLAAFHFEHHWSHAEAVRHTAEVSLRVTGVEAGYGIYFNHLFGLVWLYVAVLVNSGQGRWMRVAHGYLLCMVIQGAVVFAPWPVGLVSAVMLAGLAVVWRKRSRAEAQRR